MAASIVTACGVGPQDAPESLDVAVAERSLPIGTGADSDDDGPVDERPVVDFASTLYLIAEDDELVPVTRDLAARAGTAAQLRTLFETLVNGPSDQEVAAGLRSAIPPTTEVLDARLDDGTLTLDLSGSFASIGGPSELLAVGQLVLTGTTFPGARQLVLRLDGTATAIPLPGGALTERPVTLREFSSLLAGGT